MRSTAFVWLIVSTVTVTGFQVTKQGQRLGCSAQLRPTVALVNPRSQDALEGLRAALAENLEVQASRNYGFYTGPGAAASVDRNPAQTAQDAMNRASEKGQRQQRELEFQEVQIGDLVTVDGKPATVRAISKDLYGNPCVQVEHQSKLLIEWVKESSGLKPMVQLEGGKIGIAQKGVGPQAGVVNREPPKTVVRPSFRARATSFVDLASARSAAPSSRLEPLYMMLRQQANKGASSSRAVALATPSALKASAKRVYTASVSIEMIVHSLVKLFKFALVQMSKLRALSVVGGSKLVSLSGKAGRGTLTCSKVAMAWLVRQTVAAALATKAASKEVVRAANSLSKPTFKAPAQGTDFNGGFYSGSAMSTPRRVKMAPPVMAAPAPPPQQARGMFDDGFLYTASYATSGEPSRELYDFAQRYQVPDKTVKVLIENGVADPRIVDPEDVEELGLTKLATKTLISAIAKHKAATGTTDGAFPYTRPLE